MFSKLTKAYDAALALIAPGTVIAADGTPSAIYDLGKAGWSNNYEIPQWEVGLVLGVTALNVATGDEVYSVELRVNSVAATAGSVLVKMIVIPASVLARGYLYETISKADLLDYIGSPEFIYLNFRLAGTAPSITVQAFLCNP